jgi:hypothetical protein
MGDLLKHGFWERLSDGFYKDFDWFIRQQIVYRRKNKRDLCALGYYLIYRLENHTLDDDELLRLINEETVLHLVNILENEDTPTDDELADVVDLLCNLYRLKICNPKIERLLERILPDDSTQYADNEEFETDNIYNPTAD